MKMRAGRRGIYIGREEYTATAYLYALAGADLPHAKLDEDRVRYIRRNPAGMTAKQLAAELGVHYRTVEKVRHYETWRHVI
jgi:transcriptional regulator of met regulon